MSSIQNRIFTGFYASAGNAIAVMGEISSGMLGIGRSAVQGGNQIGVAERQLRAFGTTLRYAFAGTVIFAVPTLVRNLSQLQEQLGLMSAIGQQPGGLPIIGQQIQDLATSAQKGAVDAITPMQDFNSAIVNFLSTVQNVPEDQISPIVTDIARAARLAQIPVEDATKAFTTMSVAFGRPVNRRDIRRTAQEFFILTREAPGGVTAGAQIVQQMGQLSQVTRLAGGTRPQLFGLLLSALRSGIPPSQVGRGLQFLIQTVGLPGQQTAESERALGSVGIRAGIRMPLMERLRRIFGRARGLSLQGDIGKVARLDDTTLEDIAPSGTTSQALKNLGITGPGAVFLGQIFHRIHALRTAIALLGQINVGQYQADIKTMTEAERGHVSDINDMSKAWERFRKQAQLKEAGTALQTLSLQIARIFQPVLNIGARGTVGLAGLARRHPDAAQGTVLGITGLLAALGLNRMLGGPGLGFGRMLRFGRGALPIAAAGENILTGQIPTGTATHPFFVVVLNQLGGPGGRFYGPGGGPRAPGGGGGGGVGRFVPFGVGLASLAAADVIAVAASGGGGAPVQKGRAGWLKHFYPSLYSIGVRRTGFNENMNERAVVPQGAPKWIADILQTHSVGVANRMIRDQLAHPRISTAQGAMFAPGSQALALSGLLTLDINYNQPDGTRKQKRVHVRMDNWGNGTAPQHRGQNKAKRR